MDALFGRKKQKKKKKMTSNFFLVSKHSAVCLFFFTYIFFLDHISTCNAFFCHSHETLTIREKSFVKPFNQSVAAGK